MDFGISDWLMVLGAALLVAAGAWLADRRRMRRSDPDAVGWVPWRGVSFWAMMAAVLALAAAVKAFKEG
jgi:LPXTG-motif cell wall-anchored protein